MPRDEDGFDYVGQPGYTKDRLNKGEPGFEQCHYANYNQSCGIPVVGDEIGFGVPGGKHVFNIGWGDGSPSDPQHIGLAYAPNVELKDEPDELVD